MQKSLRIQKIKSFLLENKDVQIADIKTILDVSESTIRRDIKFLSNQGFLKELHGSVVINEKKYLDTILGDRLELNYEEKLHIGKKAAMRVEDGDFVYLDAGSTTYYVPRYINAKNVTLITNGIDNAVEASRYGFEVILIGGEFKSKTMAIVGEKAIEQLEQYRFDLAFIGANGYDLEGYSTPDYKEGIIKKRALNQSHQTYILVDTSKKDIRTHFMFAKKEEATLMTEVDA